MADNGYNDSVFINCPFDAQYSNMLRACVFTIIDSGFVPRCTREAGDTTGLRLDKIVEIIRECRYGIHDLSRVELSSASNLPRFNMPFELGLFLAAKRFGERNQKQKRFLVLEKDKYRYQRFISDIAGIDVVPHNNTQKTLVLAIRDWLRTSSRRRNIPQGGDIYRRFRSFQQDIRRVCRTRAVKYDELPLIDVIDEMTAWIKLKDSLSAPLFGP